MDIKRIATDAVNETIVINVVPMDYKGQVAKRINEKMPLATVKGFRKGQVPKDLVEKQYGKIIKKEEVQKVVDLALERFVANERLNMLGSPLIKENENFDWDAQELTFEYEIGLAPVFELDLEAKNNIIEYKIKATDNIIDEYIANFQKQMGSQNPVEVVAASSSIEAQFVNEAEEIDRKTIFDLKIFKDKATADKFIGKKIGDQIIVNTKGLFKDDHQLMDYFKIDHSKIATLAVDVVITIEAIFEHELATLNQVFFNKLFGAAIVNSEEELKIKIKQELEIQFEGYSKEKLSLDVEDFLIENTKFDLPSEFLKKWLQIKSTRPMTAEEAEAEYNRTERSLRFQLIENKALLQSKIKLNFEDLKNFASKKIRQQMAQFGQTNPTDEEVQKIVMRILSNKDEVAKISNNAVLEKLFDLFIAKVNATPKEVTYDEFVAVSYGE